MKGKKAFELQFNWIFVLVAGAAILLFFATVVIKQKSISEASTKTTVLKSIDAIITGASVTIDTTKIESIPYSQIDVECNRVSIGGISRQYQNLILFSPASIRGSKFVWQTDAFGVPYRTTNFLFITSQEVRYIIIGGNSLAKAINKSMPLSLNKEFYTALPEIKNSNDYAVRFIVFGDIIAFPASLQKMPDSDVTMLKISGDANKGELDFYQKSGNSWMLKGNSFYIGKPSLLAAAYTDAFGVYQCNMQNVFSRMKLVTKIYSEKVNELLKSASSIKQSSCGQFYSSALAAINKIYSASSNFNKESVETITDSAKSLADENRNAQIYSCPLIY